MIYARLAALIAALGLSACAQTTATVSADAVAEDTVLTIPAYDVVDINIRVPETLRVSDGTGYYPFADVVWRGDPPGDRLAQVEAIFEQSMAAGTAPLDGDVPVILDVQVERFHSLTERARYTVGGVHSIQFVYQLRDAETGEIVNGPKQVDASFRAYGGRTAVVAENAGQTQKVRILDQLESVIFAELRRPVEAPAGEV